MAKVTLRIGAAVDRSLETAFASIESRASKASAAISREFALASTGGRATKRAFDDTGTAAEKAKRGVEALGGAYRTSGKAAADMGKQAAEGMIYAGREAEKALTKIARSQAAYQRRQEGKGFGAQAGKLAASGAAALGRGALSMGASVIGGLARGAGVETDVGALQQKNVQLETRALDISNSGYLPGDKENGQRIDPKTIAKEVMGVSQQTATSTDDVSGALQAFTGKAGNLKMGREMLPEFLKVAKATGSKPEDVASAAAALYNSDKGQSQENIMAGVRTLAGQGKMGTAEMRDYAPGTAKITASAGQFNGDKGKNVGVLGALVQLANPGGAATAAQQLTSVQNLSADVLKHRDKFSKTIGHDVMENGAIMDPRKLIMETLQKTKGDAGKLTDLFGQRSVRSVNALAETYRQNIGGGSPEEQARAAAAVKAQLDELTGATMSATEVQQSFAASMATTASKTEVMNLKFQEATGALATSLMPAVTVLATALGGAATSVSNFITGLSGGKEEDRQIDASHATIDATNALSSNDVGALKKAKAELEASIKAAKDSTDPSKRSIGEQAAGVLTNLVDEKGAKEAEVNRTRETERQLGLQTSLLGKAVAALERMEKKPNPTPPVVLAPREPTHAVPSKPKS